MQAHVNPFLVQTIGHLPYLGLLFQPSAFGIGKLTAGLVLAIMVLPFIAAVMRDIFLTVPPELREAAYGLGATTTEVVWNVILPYGRVGVVGAVMLGLGRALGETMAVTFVIGNAYGLGWSLLGQGTTISSSLANEFSEAYEPMHLAALLALGFVLFVLTFIVIALARRLLMRLQKQFAGAR
jgi:phosphate transport system permease protein